MFRLTFRLIVSAIMLLAVEGKLLAKQEVLAAEAIQAVPTRIAFGSCGHQDHPQPVLKAVVDRKPDLFIYLGDNIYGDTKDMEILKSKYEKLGAKPEFQNLRATVPVLSTWDDHDYGWNDAGKEYAFKEESKEIFMDFWRVPQGSPRRNHEGIYGSHKFTSNGKTLQVILLDTRTFRDPLKPNAKPIAEGSGLKNQYQPDATPGKTLLGDEQWGWLESVLQEEADLRIICSSIQFGHEYNGWESWTNLPSQQQKMVDTIKATGANGVVFISGDVHWGEISKREFDGCYPIYDVTASGITMDWHNTEPNKFRVGPVFRKNHFGLIEVDWNQVDPEVTMSIVDKAGTTQNSHSIPLSDLQFENDQQVGAAEVLPAQIKAAELVLMNGNIFTVDQSRPTAEAIAISRSRIVAIGANEKIKRHIGAETEVVDLKGKFVMPGFIEGHAHFVGLGESMMMLNLHRAEKWDDIVEQVAEAAKVTPPGEWIVGRGWHQSKWSEAPSDNVDGYPTAKAMDLVSPNNPVLLTHASGHASFANGYAMRLAGVDAQTQNPSGGEILKDETGKPTGVFRETAAGLITRVRQRAEAKRTDAEKSDYIRRAVQLASEECLRKGVTSFQDAGSTLETVEQLKWFAENGKLGVRLWVMIRDRNERMDGRLARYKMIGYGNEFLTCRALKRSIDGALGPHGAWLLAPYSDMPSSSGLNTASIESVTRTAELGIENDFQVCVHAIGDRANREVLDIYEKLFKAHPSNIPRRWRIEHAQHLHPDDIPRFGELGVIASMQAVHCTSDAIFVPTRLGMRRSQEGAYVWKSLRESGAIVTNGTDAPVEDVNPLDSFYAAVTRRIKNGSFFPEQNMTREEAIRSYTIDCAYAAFEETSKGSLVPGKLADIVVLSNDLTKCPDDEIKNTKVLMTIVGGDVAFRNEAFQE